MDYIQKLCREVETDLERLSLSPRDKEKIQSCLDQLQDTSQTFKKLLRTGLDVLFTQTARPRLRQLFGELFNNYRYVLSEEEYAESESLGGMIVVTTTVLGNLVEGALTSNTTREGFVKKCIVGFEKMYTDDFQRFMTESNFSSLIQLCVDMFVKEWERMVTSSSNRFNALGAIRFDKDLRNVSSYLNNLLPMGTVRDRFVRLVQISLLVNMESASELSEYCGNEDESVNIQWRLTNNDIRKVLALRFGSEEASRVKL